jgi:hypothetical protein
MVDLSGNFQCPLDVVCLPVLVATREQDHNVTPLSDKVDPIARTIVDAQFTDALEELMVAEISHLDTVNAGLDANFGLPVS